MRVTILWQTFDSGLYSNHEFDLLYKNVGHNNGNLAFVYAIQSQIDADITFAPWHAKSEYLDEISDIIVLPCANQLGPHTKLGGLAENLSRLKTPVVGIGIGAQAKDFSQDVVLDPGTLEWVRQLDVHRPDPGVSNLYTRGPYTTSQLKKLGVNGTCTGGCPSHFIHPAVDLGQKIAHSWNEIQQVRKISVCAGHQSWAEVREIEQQLVGLLFDPACTGQYIVQSMTDMVKISRGDFDTIEPEVFQRLKNHIVPHYTDDEFRAFCLNYVYSFYDVPAWMDSLRRYDLAIGPRYHGIALALQAERMGVVITIDTRTEEMCQQTGIPYIRVQDCTRPLVRSSLRSLIQFDADKYDEFRSERARNYVNFLEANQLKPKAFLKEIAAG
ncbi:polysaccharide pyruvyl transferase family protein [Abyssibius alkaniclasticus]|uniref:polysaccharide pyruvyl transferase family protein n=1 Tax=Abyssibius alkaniclasticus TaxID=2881234 RepID=UPI002363FB9B|nr:polysaccharide pyruvyl transferase family protein [Abyssibius alkaniclasticus]UPH72525.1 polysaccharide pyruvyl transferase family protein [Abyssibius alkaniclasticus]|tara:strand:+ start:897 stop:2048 length:1152 start_codon:yes stop_codon:yes gene_type:complete